MAKLIKKEEVNILWSDGPVIKPAAAQKRYPEIIPSQVTLKIGLEKNKRGGKIVSTIFNYPENPDYFEALSKELKKSCGTGGSFKGDHIEIQGDHREKLKKILEQKGFQVKFSGG